MQALLYPSTYDDAALLSSSCHQVFRAQCALNILSLMHALLSFSVTASHAFALIFAAIGFAATRTAGPGDGTGRTGEKGPLLDAGLWPLLAAVTLYMALAQLGAFLSALCALGSLGSAALILVLLKTGVTGLQVFAFSRLWLALSTDSLKSRSSFYINILILNRKEVIADKMKKKAGKVGGMILGKIVQRNLGMEGGRPMLCVDICSACCVHVYDDVLVFIQGEKGYNDGGLTVAIVVRQTVRQTHTTSMWRHYIGF